MGAHVRHDPVLLGADLNPLAGAIDTHVHSGPDVVPRAQDDVELAQSAAAAGMRAIVLKSHHFSTADRAVIAGRQVQGLTVVGGLALNFPSCGGLNPDAVRAALAIGGRVVWLPTISAANNLAHVRRGAGSTHLGNLTSSVVAVAVVDPQGRPLAALDSIFELVAEHDAVLATGHLAHAESVSCIARAQELGVRRIVVTHPELGVVGMPRDVQRELAQAGVMFERCYLNVINGLPVAEFLADARAVGLNSTIVATDLGQAVNPPATEGFRACHAALTAAGMTAEEWALVTRHNPARLLGLEDSA